KVIQRHCGRDRITQEPDGGNSAPLGTFEQARHMNYVGLQSCQRGLPHEFGSSAPPGVVGLRPANRRESLENSNAFLGQNPLKACANILNSFRKGTVQRNPYLVV